MVSSARELGFSLTVQDVLNDPRLSAVAAATASSGNEDEAYDVPPFSLVPLNDIDSARARVASLCGLSSADHIQDILLTTALQQEFIEFTAVEPYGWVRQIPYKLRAGVDVSHFKAAWERIVELYPVHRTRIVLHDGMYLQVVTKHDPQWEPQPYASVDDSFDSLRTIKMGYGTSLCRYSLLTSSTGDSYFVLVIHHGLFDLWSLNLVFAALNSLYLGLDPSPSRPYAALIKYISQSLESAGTQAYWRQELADLQPAVLPFAKSVPPGTAQQNLFLHRQYPFPRSTGTSFTKATILRGAWALLWARYCRTDDICFLTTVLGRHAAVPGVEGMVGMALSHVLVRVKLSPPAAPSPPTVDSFLSQIQSQASEMIPHEQFGLPAISAISAEARQACQFPWEFLIQPERSGPQTGPSSVVDSQLLSPTKLGGDGPVNGYESAPICLDVSIQEEAVELQVTYNPAVVGVEPLERLCTDYMALVRMLLDRGERRLVDVQL